MKKLILGLGSMVLSLAPLSILSVGLMSSVSGCRVFVDADQDDDDFDLDDDFDDIDDEIEDEVDDPFDDDD